MIYIAAGVSPAVFFCLKIKKHNETKSPKYRTDGFPMAKLDLMGP